MRSVAAVRPAEIASSERRNFVRKRILLTQKSRLWSICLGKGHFAPKETRNGLLTHSQSSIVLPTGGQGRGKLLSNDAYSVLARWLQAGQPEAWEIGDGSRG